MKAAEHPQHSAARRANIRREALAFRLWQICQPFGWDITLHDAAEHLGVHTNAVLSVARRKGWLNRFRSQKLDTSGIAMPTGPSTVHAVDAMFDGGDDMALLRAVA